MLKARPGHSTEAIALLSVVHTTSRGTFRVGSINVGLHLARTGQGCTVPVHRSQP